MRIFLLFMGIAAFLTSCTRPQTTTFTTKNIDLKSTVDCEKENCTYVHLEIPVASGNALIAQPINDTLFGFIQKKLRLEGDSKTTSYDSLAQRFVRRYEEINQTYPSESVAWEANFKVSQRTLSTQTHQIVWDYYLFSGGAFGLQAAKVYFFNLENGAVIPTKDLFLNYEGFKNFAEIEFKKQLNVKNSFAEAGFTFKNNTFDLPQNFYETDDEWILYYNPYEIASHAQGAVVVKLPKTKVAPYLNPIHFKN